MVGRPRQFDADEALETAMRLFWSRGYKATGLSDLIAETGVAKQSLYNTFGHKKKFFLRTLDLYSQTVVRRFREELASGSDNVDGIRNVLLSWADAAHEAEPFGCFLTNTMTEIGRRDPEIADFLQAQAVEHERTFEDAIRKAQANGEVPQDRDARKLARGLLASSNGLMVLAKLGVPESTYHDAVDATLSILR